MLHVTEPNEKVLRWSFAVIAAPFFLNDFANIYVTDWRLWLFIDYVFVKLFPVLGAVWLIRRKVVSTTDLGLKWPGLARFVIGFATMSLLGILMNENLHGLFIQIFGSAHLGAMPQIKTHAWEQFDLTFGLFMVGVTEELVFRGILYRVLSGWTGNRGVIVAVSALIFGLIHWSNGIHSVLNAALIGAVFMAFYLRARSLPALMLAHFFVDFVAFAGVIPREWFQFAARN